MEETSAEKRIELIRQARAQSLAGSQLRTGRFVEKENSKGRSTFQLRFLAAVLLLACAILIDKSNINLAGITSETIARVISADYEEHLEEWVSTIAK